MSKYDSNTLHIFETSPCLKYQRELFSFFLTVRQAVFSWLSRNVRLLIFHNILQAKSRQRCKYIGWVYWIQWFYRPNHLTRNLWKVYGITRMNEDYSQLIKFDFFQDVKKSKLPNACKILRGIHVAISVLICSRRVWSFIPSQYWKHNFFPSRENTLANKQEKFFCRSGVRGVFVTDRPTFVRVFCIKKVKTKSRADGKKNCLRLKEPEQYTKIIKRQQRHHWTIVLIKISWERKTKLWASATTLVIGINNVQV